MTVRLLYVLRILHHWLKDTHVLQDLPVSIVDAVLAVEAVLDQLAIGIDLVNDRVGIVTHVMCEDRYLAQLREFHQEFPQIGPFENIDIPTEFFIL